MATVVMASIVRILTNVEMEQTFVIQTRLAAIQDILLVDICRSTNVLMEATTATTMPLAQTLMAHGPVRATLVTVLLVKNE